MIYSSLQGISGVQEWKQFSEYLLSIWWWPSPSQLELFSADKVRNLRWCLLDGCRCTRALLTPALAKASSCPGAGDVTLCAGVGGLSFCDRSEGQQCLGRSRGSWSCRSLGRGFTPQGLEQPPKGSALKKEGRRLRNRELPGSLPELVTRSFSSVIFIPRVATHL